MIDMHLYRLLGVDDGQETLEDALAPAHLLAQEGFYSTITPQHYNDKLPYRSTKKLQLCVAKLQNGIL